MYKLNLIFHRYRHHCGHSGYDRITSYLRAEQTNGKAAPWFVQLLPNRVVSSIVWRAKVGAYTKDRLLAELGIAGKLLGRRPEIFHFLYGEDAYCYSGFIPRAKGKKIAATFHQPPDYFERVIRRRNHLNKLDGVVVVSRNQSEYFQGIVDEGKVTFIPHGVDTDFFRPGQRENKKKRKCLFIGRWFRDFETLREVVKIVSEADADIEFTIVTTVKGLEQVEGLKGAEILCGVPEDELVELYQSSSLLVLPLIDSTANNSILEALACGLPIIATDVGGVRDYLDENCAVLAEPKNAEAMAQKVFGLIDDEQRLEQIGNNARNKALEFSWPVIAQKLTEFYSRLYC
jgi:glycosyltransferase involved in cell wall biosynthesis